MSKIFRKKAEEIFKNTQGGIPVDLEKIAREYNLKIQTQPMDDSVSGMLVTDMNSAVIVVNSQQTRNRQRFTIAHEIGHYIFHHKPNTVFVDNINILYRSKDTGSTRKEIDANIFAAELLMPASIITEEVSKIESNIFDDEMAKSLADQFQVSAQALTYRLLNLGIIHA